jgi:hypothetical protein
MEVGVVGVLRAGGAVEVGVVRLGEGEAVDVAVLAVVRDFQDDLDPAVIDRHKGDYVGETVLAGLAETAFSKIKDILDKFGVMLERVDLRVGMHLELRQGLLLDDPVADLCDAIEDQDGREDNIDDIVLALFVEEEDDEPDCGEEAKVEKVGDVEARVGLLLQ